MPPEISPAAIMDLGFAYWGSKTLLTAVELGLFTELAKGPLTLSDIRARLNLHERSARDFLDALVALGMLEREQGAYRNTPATDLYLDRAKPTYIGGMLEMMSARLFRFWGDLTEGLKTGLPQNEAKHGGDLFDTLYGDPARLELFLSAMTGLSLGIAHTIAAKFPWAQYRTFVDIGAAQGGLPVVLARAHQHLTGVGADLPVVRPIFEKYVASNGLQDRLHFAKLNFFEEPLPGADVIIMGHILHDWDLPTKRMLLQKAYDALPAGGALIVFEALIDDERRTNAFGLLMSLNMLIETRGGFDYSGADCAGWMRDAGFRETRVEPLTGPDAMVVGVKVGSRTGVEATGRMHSPTPFLRSEQSESCYVKDFERRTCAIASEEDKLTQSGKAAKGVPLPRLDLEEHPISFASLRLCVTLLSSVSVRSAASASSAVSFAAMQSPLPIEMASET